MTDYNQPEDDPEFNAPDIIPGFDPRKLPGAEVIYDGTDEDGDGLAVVAVPVSALGGDLPPEVLELLGEAAALASEEPDETDAVLTNFQQMGWALEEID